MAGAVPRLRSGRMDLDAEDRAFVDTMIPDDAVPVTFIAVVSYLGADGKQHFREYVQTEELAHAVVGLLTIVAAKLGYEYVQSDD